MRLDTVDLIARRSVKVGYDAATLQKSCLTPFEQNMYKVANSGVRRERS